MDWASLPYGLLAAALVIGFVVGLTGMGGGALMTPILVVFFGIPPLTAVSSDLIAAAVMKPFGSAVHIRHGTVNWRIVRWLVVGSVPSAFAGVLIIRFVGEVVGLQSIVKTTLGVALLIAATGLIFRSYLKLRERTSGGVVVLDDPNPPVRIIPTVIVGIVGGLMVGMTSVGSGSLVIIALMLLYPVLQANRLVGTDLVQAVPLVVAAAIGHLIFGDVDWSIALPLSIGSIPGVLIGARVSSRVPGGIVRRALAAILLAAGVKLLGASNEATLAVLIAAPIVGTLAWMGARRLRGLPMTFSAERRSRRGIDG